MKKNLALFVLSGIAFCSLAGCKGEEGSYFTIEVYSDYEGMEADLANTGTYRTSAAVKIGVCYALKNKKANIGAIQAYSDSEGKNYSYRNSQRTAPRGYAYKFKELKGFYEPSKPVDLAEITANCAVFATFDLNPKDYLVTVKDAFGSEYKDFSDFLPFGTVVGTNEKLSTTLKDFPVHDPEADPSDPSTWRDSYYIDYKPQGWYVFEYDEDDKIVTYPGKDYHDAKGNVASDFLPYDGLAAIDAYVINNKTVFEPAYDEGTKKEYTVTLSYQLRTLTGYETSGKAIYAYDEFPLASTLPASQTVLYGAKVNLSDPSFVKEGYAIVGTGKNGKAERYDATDPMIPTTLVEEYYEGGVAKKHGLPIDADDIRYNCSITIVYERDISCTVSFHNDPANPADPVAEVVVREGAKAVAPSLVSVPAGYTFTGEWTSAKGSTTPVSLENITADIELYPVLVSSEIVTAGGLTFVPTLDAHGYALIDATDVPANYALTEASFETEFPEGWPFVAVTSFGAATKNITSLVLPASVQSVNHGVFATMSSLESVDLSKTQIAALQPYCFQNLVLLNEVHLPASLTNVGNDLFRNCTSLHEVHIDLTEAEVTERGFPTNWASGKTVIYKVA